MSDAFTESLPRLRLPLTPQEARALKLGDVVVLGGEVTVTAGFVTHQRMVAALESGQELPLDMRGGSFFHMGSRCRETQAGWLPDYVNPTTSRRFDAFMPSIIRGLGLTAVGGKGGLGDSCLEAMRKVGCVYFSMPGGASPMLSLGAVERLETGWDDLIEQFRLSCFALDGFGPVTVAIDAHGNSLYSQLMSDARSRLPGILDALEEERLAAGR